MGRIGKIMAKKSNRARSEGRSATATGYDDVTESAYLGTPNDVLQRAFELAQGKHALGVIARERGMLEVLQRLRLCHCATFEKCFNIFRAFKTKQDEQEEREETKSLRHSRKKAFRDQLMNATTGLPVFIVGDSQERLVVLREQVTAQTLSAVRELPCTVDYAHSKVVKDATNLALSAASSPWERELVIFLISSTNLLSDNVMKRTLKVRNSRGQAASERLLEFREIVADGNTAMDEKATQRVTERIAAYRSRIELKQNLIDTKGPLLQDRRLLWLQLELERNKKSKN